MELSHYSISSESRAEQFIIEDGINTDYIDTILFNLFYQKDLFDFLLSNKLKILEYYFIQEFIKNIFVNKIRNNLSISSENINELRHLFINNGWSDYDNIFKKYDPIDFYSYLVSIFEIIPIKLITKQSVNSKKILKKESLINFINLELPFNSNDIYKLSTLIKKWYSNNEQIRIIDNIPTILVFHINRFNKSNSKNSTKIDIPKKIKPFKYIYNSKYKNISWDFSSIICVNGFKKNKINYYSILKNKNEWILFNNKNYPCLKKINIKNNKIKNIIMSDAKILIYKLNY